jgi:hypothetical protein
MDDIKTAVQAAKEDNPNSFAEKINSSLMAKVADALKTKKIEISNKWLNDIEPPSSEEEE